MPKIIVLPHEKICPQGAELEIESGSNLCRSLLDHGIPIEHACDLSGACTTCHVVVKKGFDSLEEMDDVEADLLDRAWGLTAESRLSCQVKVQDENLEVEIPKYTVNYISDHHE
ncbi:MULTISPECIES: ISC system 2Fe-2S type ferredoxin [Acinetobacter]|jgi:2Fe-2S ferredoxin|uniref:2Fe-2S ferredoxin n=8 Tax=Acinetobacter TaxID=469 RepID=A0A7Z1WC39_ACIJO|nr:MULTISPECIES: ISC system 2Fe-2S type ferredoxin [Acinetobacter]AMO42079.1 2Fe-2S ferredoxin [Acinetobacter sp. DUT-2]MEC8567697.1 ISC system 2Fe-2S type ferredoxin [Pseudomonadota bacterium]ATZ68463.1 ferredoxin, 2Fe-2S type, ISC system [Acinetobacter haemolyticus]EHU3343867.1 ISC system 2Fe-2S type ferredoxin [Acinetobacter baumannii]EJB8412740.1 ISC system 2Fe-2S type ferredoxin [Acinetobacter baumannii]